MTIFSIIVLIGIIAALVFIQRENQHVKNRLSLSENKSDLFKGSLIEQIKALQLAKYALVAVALVILSLALIKQIIITVVLFGIAFLLLSISTQRFSRAKQLSRADAQQ